jgi:pilus assembly protein CpaE
MTNSNATRIIVVGDPGPVFQQISASLNAQPEFQLIDLLSAPDRLTRDIAQRKPDIIFLDHQISGKPTLDLIDDIALEFPSMAIIAILPDNDGVEIQKAMLAGARAFIVQPFTQINLLSTLRRVKELEDRRRSQASPGKFVPSENTRPLRTIAVFSPRGGVGCSSVAANLAYAIHEYTDQRVLLLEGKQYFGHQDIILNIRSQNTLADLIPHANALDEALIRDVVIEHGSGIQVLLGPNTVHVAQGIRPDDLYSVLMGLQRAFDYIVIDAGSSLTENIVTFLDLADRILLITTPDLASIRDTSRFMQIGQTLSYSPEKILTVLNREGVPGSVRTKDIETTLRQSLFAKIPEETPKMTRSVNRGIPLMLRYPNCAASRAIKQLSVSLGDMKIVDPIRSPFGQVALKDQREALLASAQFG